jgi:hypothetical protein
MSDGENSHDVPGWLGVGFGLMPVPLLAVGLIPGPRELLLVIVVALVLYGRSGTRVLIGSQQGRPPSLGVRLLRRVLGLPVNPKPRRRAGAASDAAVTVAAPPTMPGRLFWALTLIAAVAVAALVATHVIVHHAATSPH